MRNRAYIFKSKKIINKIGIDYVDFLKVGIKGYVVETSLNVRHA